MANLRVAGIPKLKPGDHADGDGLYLRVHKSGKRSWRLICYKAPEGRLSRRGGKGERLTITLGDCPPDVDAKELKRVRELARDLKAEAERGNDPREILNPPEAVRGESFRVFARRAFEDRVTSRRISDKYARDSIRQLELHAFPHIGDRSIKDLRRADYIRVVRASRHPHKHPETGETIEGLKSGSNRLLTILQAVDSYAEATGMIDGPQLARMRNDVKFNDEAIRKQPILTLDEMRDLWAAAEEWNSILSGPLKLIMLTATRNREATEAEWSEIDIENGIWTIRADRMKGRMGRKREHVVPLSDAAVKLFEDLSQTRRTKWVFPRADGTGPTIWASKGKVIFGRAGVEHGTIHSLRRSIVTLMGDRLGVRSDITSMLLSHSPSTRLGVTAVYDKSERLEERRVALQAWADLFLEKDTEHNILPLHQTT